MTAAPADPGPAFLEAVAKKLMLDEEWSVFGERSVTWWPYRHGVTIRVSEPFEDGGVVGCRLFAETDVLATEGAGSRRADVARALVSLMRHPPMGGFVWDEEARRVRLASSVFAHEALAPFTLARFAVAVLVQATYAELGASALTALAGLPDAPSAHPAAGERTRPDALLDVVSAQVVPEGEEPSRYAKPEEILAAAEALQAHGARVTAAEGALSARLPLLASEDPFRPEASALLQVRTAEEHPELGNGVFVRLFLPGRPAAGAEGTALHLNAREMAEPHFAAACLGSWTLESAEGEQELATGLEALPRLAYVAFLPNYVFLPGTLANAAVDVASRVRAVGHFLGHESRS